MSISKPWPRLVAPALVVLVVAGVACGVACTGRPGPDVVATSDLGEVTKAELEEFILSLPEPERRPPDGRDPAAWRREKLEHLLVTRHLEQQVESNHLDGSEEASRMLAAQVDAVLIQEVEARMLRERVTVGEEDLQTFYREHPEEFRRGEQIRLRNIFRRVNRDATPPEREAARADILQLLQQLRDGANFEELAKAESDSETASLGGLIGRIDRGTLPPDQEAIIWRLAEGEISDVVETPVGFQIFRVDDHLAPEEKTLDMVRGVVTRRLSIEKTERVLREYFDELLEASGAFYDPTGLSAADEATVLFELSVDRLTLGAWRESLHAKPFYAQREKSLREQLDQWVRERLYLQEAARGGLTADPAIAAHIAGLERDVALAIALREKQAVIVAEFAERELREYYESQERRFQTPRLFHLRLITRTSEQGQGLYALYEELDRLADAIRAGEIDFADAARRFSDDHSAIAGGDVGAIRLDSFAEWAGPPAQIAVAEMAPGEVSEPMLIERYDVPNLKYDRAGYMLVQLLEIREPVPRSFDEVRGEIAEQLAASREVEIVSQITAETLDEINARVFDENL